MTNYNSSILATSHPEVTIVGLGNVGSTVASELMLENNGSGFVKVGLFDSNKAVADAQFIDLAHAYVARSKPLGNVSLSGYYLWQNTSHIVNQRIIVIAAGYSQNPGQSRLSLIESNYDIVKELLMQLLPQNPDAKFVILTNPVDVILQKLFSDPNINEYQLTSILSIGTLLDTHRLYYELEIVPNSYDYTQEVMVIGEHGDSQVLYNKTKRRISQATRRAVSTSAQTIIRGKNYTNFGVSATTRFLVDMLVNKKNAIIPLSTYYSFQSKNFATALSLPIVIQNGELTGLRQGFDTPVVARLVQDSIDAIKNAAG
jgi:L-lactate dehydrogenase